MENQIERIFNRMNCSKLRTKMKFKPRNFVVKDLVLHKGGAHEKSTKAKRKQNKQNLLREIRLNDNVIV